MFKVNTSKQHTGLAHTDCRYECIGVFPKYLKQTCSFSEQLRKFGKIIPRLFREVPVRFCSWFSASVNEACEIKIYAIRHRGAEILVCEVGGIFVHITVSSEVCYCVILLRGKYHFDFDHFWIIV